MSGILASCINMTPCNDTPGIGQPHEGTPLAPIIVGVTALLLLGLAIWLALRVAARRLR